MDLIIMETRQGLKHARKLPYYKTMEERDDKKTNFLVFFPPLLHCRVVFLHAFIPASFLDSLHAHPYLNKFL